MISPRRVTWACLFALGVVVSALAVPSLSLAQTPIAAPVIGRVSPGDGSLAIEWTAPAGVTGITAYDLRYIETSADESVDANWTEVEDVWTSSGDLEYTLDGLDNLVLYDVQVRAVTTTDGIWSGTPTGTPRIPAPTIATVSVGDGALTVAWSTPVVAATTVIGTHDLRYIETAASDKSDSEWTIVLGFWTEGALNGVLAGLTNGTG